MSVLKFYLERHTPINGTGGTAWNISGLDLNDSEAMINPLPVNFIPVLAATQILPSQENLRH